jgi:lysophospholipase L1-like esterase
MFRPAQLAKAVLAMAGGAIFCAVAYMMGTGKYLSSPILWTLIPLSIATAAAHRRPRLIALLYLAVVLLAFGSESVLETRIFRADLEKAFAIRDYVMERRRIEEFLATHGTDTGYARLSVPQQQDAQGNFLGLTLRDGKVVMPFLYQPGTTNLACKERGEWDLLYADRYGFFNPNPLWDSPAQVAIAGGSDIAGGCVAAEERIDTRLRHAYPRLLNLSVPGTGALFRNAAIVEYARLVKPRVVVWFYTENDLLVRASDAKFPFLRKYLEPSFVQDIEHYRDQIWIKEPFKKQNFPDEALWPYLTRGIKERLPGLISLRETRGLLRNIASAQLDEPSDGAKYFAQPAAADLADYIDFVERSQHEVLKWGGAFLVVIYPSPFTSQASAADNRAYDAGRKLIAELMRQRGLVVLDLTKDMTGPDAIDLTYPPSWAPAHLNSKGHAVLASRVEGYLRDALPGLPAEVFGELKSAPRPGGATP